MVPYAVRKEDGHADPTHDDGDAGVSNAHPALRDVADEVTASNADDGLAPVLERWCAG